LVLHMTGMLVGKNEWMGCGGEWGWGESDEMGDE
jgi:hypothetical protein